MVDASDNAQRLLVVDGDVIVRHAICAYLRQCGYVVVEAASTDEAVAVLDTGQLVVEAILCDADAPGRLNAFEFRQWVLNRQPVQFALAGSVDGLANKAAELCEDGPQLRRPYDPQSVTAYIKRLLGTSRAA